MGGLVCSWPRFVLCSPPFTLCQICSANGEQKKPPYPPPNHTKQAPRAGRLLLVPARLADLEVVARARGVEGYPDRRGPISKEALMWDGLDSAGLSFACTCKGPSLLFGGEWWGGRKHTVRYCAMLIVLSPWREVYCQCSSPKHNLCIHDDVAILVTGGPIALLGGSPGPRQ